MKHRIVLHGVDFASRKSSIRSDALPVLNEAVQCLREEERIIVVGIDPDSVGSSAFDCALAHRRAKSVREYLTAEGIAAQRIVVDGQGGPSAVASNGTADSAGAPRPVKLHVD